MAGLRQVNCEGRLFRAIKKAGWIWGGGMTPKVLWESSSMPPRLLVLRSLCHFAGGELDQIQFRLGHVSIQTTEHYLGCKQKLRIAVNDKLGIQP